ncbi:hypothetical protein PIB30_075960 [Stylosanthes scabra]|uniref:Aminotransferase-like plant mobile domain-containing protein n=1 Tax=Stylosanthes scabra TaxID=79078 RepID=A0ABU6UR86_9FABA|nr:hypothetical protein [Stylosanthes scabra]
MAPRGRSRTPGRDRFGDQPAPAPEANPQDPEGLYRLNDEWHIAGALRERVLLLRKCSFLMPAPDVLLPFLEEAGFGHAIQLRDFVFDAPLLSAFVERWRPETHTFHMPWGCCYHLGLRTDGDPVEGCLRDFGTHHEQQPWDMVE